MKSLLKAIIPDTLKDAYRDFKKRQLLYSLRGHAVHCPICSCEFKSFLPHGYPKRPGAKCPNCGSLERHRLQFLYLKNCTSLFDTTKKQSILHFAPETFFIDYFLKFPHLDYVGCDINPGKYTMHGKYAISRVDITSIPYDDMSFDVILCNHVLEHIPNDRLAMNELYRVMAKGGWGVFQVPIDYNRAVTFEDFSIVTPEARTAAFGQSDHVRWYGRDYTERLRSVGFSVEEDRYVDTFTETQATKFGVNRTEVVYRCRRK